MKYGRYLSWFWLLLSMVMVVGGWSLNRDTEYLLANTIETAKVSKGELHSSISGYGQLESLNQRLLTSSSVAVVDQILMRPGAKVAADDIILLLKNPDLEAELKKSQADLQNTILNKKKMRLEQERELLDQESAIAQVNSDAEMAQALVDAQSKLAEQGIVAAMDYKQNVVKARQLKQKAKFEQSKIAKLKEVQKEHLAIMDEEIAQARSELAVFQQRVAQLQVKAGISGVVLRMPVSLGQRVTIGEELALVGSTTPLIAKIKVPYMQASSVVVGAPAQIDSHSALVKGKVTRVDPVVNDGAVEVEIALPKKIPNDIRPMQVVDAEIDGKSAGAMVYVKKPQNIKAGEKLSIFKKTSALAADRVPVTFGKTINDMVEVVAGLAPGDEILLNAPLADSDVKHIRLTQAKE